MYSRSSAKNLRVPHNYGGSTFSSHGTTPVEDLTRKRPPSPHVAEYQAHFEDIPKNSEKQDSISLPEDCPQPKSHATPVLSPLGELGTEELLLIALALIIFQSGKEPQLALILLALLFVQ